MTDRLNCRYCGKPIPGKYFRDYWGNNYCIEHLKNAPRCDYCGRLIGKEATHGGKAYSDGRRICGICLPSAVTGHKDGLGLLTEVRNSLANEGIEISPFRPEFALISRSRMKQLDRKDGEQQGYAVFSREVAGNGKILSFTMQIFILNGLPKESFISTAAHELMHIWFYSRNITDISPTLAEGSCNMASYLVLRRMKTLEAEYLIKGLFENRDRVYGAGFRKVQRFTEKHGIDGWLEYARRHRRI